MSLGAGPEHDILFTPQRSVCESVLSIMGRVKTCGSRLRRLHSRWDDSHGTRSLSSVY